MHPNSVQKHPLIRVQAQREPRTFNVVSYLGSLTPPLGFISFLRSYIGGLLERKGSNSLCSNKEVSFRQWVLTSSEK